MTTTDKPSAGELLRGAKSFGAIIDDPRALRIGFDRPVTDDHRAALLAAINAAIVSPPVAGAEVGVREAHHLNQLELLESAGYDSTQVHPYCYKNFSHVKFTNNIIAALSTPVAERGGGGASKTKAVLLEIAAERERQIAKGYDAAHDDLHWDGAIADAAACFASRKHLLARGHHTTRPVAVWPWEGQPGGDRREALTIAAALCVAEIERLDRTAAPTPETGDGSETRQENADAK